MPLMLPIINGIFGLILVFISCELGQRMADAFEEIEITIDRCDWYLLPIKTKRTLLMIIANVQQPVEVGCFGSTTCAREVFKNVGINKL